jgi:nicotinamidase-related amidase
VTDSRIVRRMARGLVIVDIQNDYFPGGANPLDGPEAAAAQAARLLSRFRQSGEPLVHMQHVWDAPDASFMPRHTRRRDPRSGRATARRDRDPEASPEQLPGHGARAAPA